MKQTDAYRFPMARKNVFLPYFLVILTLCAFCHLLLAPYESSAGEAYAEWGEMGRRFLLPLTYPDYDPADFGREPDPEDMDILRNHRPRIYIAPGGLRPIDFYEDYLPRCVVRDDRRKGVVVEENPTREYLKKIERTHGMYLDYTGPNSINGSPVAYARVYREDVALPGPRSGSRITIPFTFLKYNFAFLYSGLPAKISWIKEVAARLAGDPEKWHELDIHGSIIVALARIGGALRPVALTLAQHNHYRTYLHPPSAPGSEKDWRPAISFALRSNEPYPLPEGDTPVEYPAVGDPSGFSFVIMGKGFSLFSGYDLAYSVKSGATPVEDYRLESLSYRDPLYVSWAPLGAKLKIFGLFNTFYRAGPPGIDLNTWPELAGYGRIMTFWYVKDKDRQAARLFDEHLKDFVNPNLEPIMNYNSRRFANDLFNLYPQLVEDGRQ